MFITFFRIISTYVIFIYFSVKIQNCIFYRTKNIRHLIIMVTITHTILSLVSMYLIIDYKGLIINLRSVPIYVLSYSLGWGYGSIVIITNILFDILSGNSIFNLLFICCVVFPYIIGSSFYYINNRPNNKIHDLTPMNFKKVFQPFLIIVACKILNIRIVEDFSTKTWLISSLIVSGLSIIALAIIITVINDLIYKNLYKNKSMSVEERFDKLVENLTDSVIIHRYGIIKYVNPAGLKLLGGHQPEDIIGKSILDFVPKERKEKVVKIYKTFEIKKSDLRRETEFKKLSGQTIQVELYVNIVTYDNELARLLIVRDITKHKENENKLRELLSENRKLLRQTIEYDNLKTEFFANISHELKTPLNIILGGIQLVGNKNDSNTNCRNYNSYKKNLKMMRQNCLRLLRLINNLIDITKLDTGYLKLERKNYDLIQVVENITLSVVEYAKNNGITIIFDTNIEERIMSFDIDKIERVMLNLLSNSIKFSKDEGNIEVNIQDIDNYVLITVKDDGIGIPPDKLDSIFERFRRVDPLMTRKNEGSGIGLSLVKSIVEAHEGRIYVNSEYGEGTEFTIKLPIKFVKSNEVCMESAIALDSNSKIEKISIEFSDIYK
ncbi:PAS domain-containing sensor histidine kinase [Sporosalibacterium faouarense]|uniref:PAS domain-containing sensor histidine kinase n=1 Tax=Sporosalibacterium faouarense TaxID=516123 RepID=UPI00192AEE79|nr:PAS domain-containing sensor histidine kinase [Sporosalibacterium faouarense]